MSSSWWCGQELRWVEDWVGILQFAATLPGLSGGVAVVCMYYVVSVQKTTRDHVRSAVIGQGVCGALQQGMRKAEPSAEG